MWGYLNLNIIYYIKNNKIILPAFKYIPPLYIEALISKWNFICILNNLHIMDMLIKLEFIKNTLIPKNDIILNN